MRFFTIITFLIGGLFSKAQERPYTKDTVLMGSAFSFSAVHDSKAIAIESIYLAIAEVDRVEQLISSWKENSETNAINKNAGVKPVKVSVELFQLIERCLKVSQLTNGAFDISFASLDPVWDFDKAYQSLPHKAEIEKSIALVNYKNIVLDKIEHTVFLKDPGMKIGFGAIGKGYSADMAKAVMQSKGVKSGVVNAGGDLISWGFKPNTTKPWSVGITDPFDKSKMKMWLAITNAAVVTSGNYEKFIVIDGEHYSHILNPNTGWPVSGVASVSVICPSAELADALATSVFVMGVEKGMELINGLNGVEAILINDNGAVFYSKNIKQNIVDFK